MTDHATLIRRALDPATAAAFDRRVRRQADRLVEAIAAGAFDNDAVTVGLELEAYAVDVESGRLAPIPEDVFDGPAAKELGVHDVELNAAPTRLDADGVAEQAATLERDLATTRERARAHGLDVVLDAMWVVPPAGGTVAYLDDVVVDWGDARDVTDPDGDEPVVPGPDPSDPVVIARHMRRDPRYGALDNEAVRRAGGRIDFSVPGADLSVRTILFESLATSIQPHVQVPDVDAFPRYHNLAVRTLGPLLALSTNAPFLPTDCYGADPETVVEETHHELRIAAFEQSMNQGSRKVRVPDDVETATGVVERVVADDTFGPFLREWVDDGTTEPSDGTGVSDASTAETGDGTEASDGSAAHPGIDGSASDAAGDGLVDVAECWEFDYKRGTRWRWVRGVVGGTAVDGACDERSLRLEYRPLPTQPTVRDVVGLQVLTAGLLRGLVAADHPLADLPWDAAEASFYAAVRDGPDADLAWVAADGERTADADRIFAEVFEYARRGLAEQGIPPETRDRYLDPIEARWERGVTPSVWKRERVREALADGATFAEALESMQREYVRASREHGTFVDWLD